MLWNSASTPTDRSRTESRDSTQCAGKQAFARRQARRPGPLAPPRVRPRECAPTRLVVAPERVTGSSARKPPFSGKRKPKRLPKSRTAVVARRGAAGIGIGIGIAYGFVARWVARRQAVAEKANLRLSAERASKRAAALSRGAVFRSAAAKRRSRRRTWVGAARSAGRREATPAAAHIARSDSARDAGDRGVPVVRDVGCARVAHLRHCPPESSLVPETTVHATTAPATLSDETTPTVANTGKERAAIRLRWVTSGSSAGRSPRPQPPRRRRRQGAQKFASRSGDRIRRWPPAFRAKTEGLAARGVR